MKKVLFCLSLIFGLLVLNQVPSFAMEASFETIGGLGDLGYGLIGGATFDFDGTEYTIDDFDNLSEALKQEAADRKAREFLQAYCMARGIPIPNIDPDLPATTGKEFYKSQYFDSANRTVWNNYKLGRTTIEQQEALRFPIGPQAFSDWSGYSAFWYKKYINDFNNSNSDNIAVNPDPLYIADINYINYKDSFHSYDSFWFYDMNDIYSYGRYKYIIDCKPWTSFSFYCPYDSAYNFNRDSYLVSFSCSNILDINIISNNNDTYSYSVQLNFITPFLSQYKDDNLQSEFNSVSVSDYNVFTGINKTLPSSDSYTGSLSDIFDRLKASYKNINIYVNGNPWSLVSNPSPANPTIPSFPDVIGGNSEDPLPAYDIVFPNTSDFEGTFDITSLFDALKEAIIGASDSDDSTDSTLTREKVTDTFKDKVGEAVGEATKTIDDVMEDSFPIEGTLNYPNLPPIPQIPLDNAFAGTTILSELIDACQQILPSPLALAFWGMIFILFIIGLIRILHK